MDVPQPDEKSIITYVSSLYDAMPRVPEVQDGVKANVSLGAGGHPPPPAAGAHPHVLPSTQELQLRWQEYYEVVTLLLQWIRQHTVLFEERRFPASYEEIEVREPGWCPGAGRGMKGSGEPCRCLGRCLAVAQLAGDLAVGWLMPGRVLLVRATLGRHAPSPAALQAHAGLGVARLRGERGGPAVATALPVSESATGPSPSWVRAAWPWRVVGQQGAWCRCWCWLGGTGERAAVPRQSRGAPGREGPTDSLFPGSW